VRGHPLRYWFKPSAVRNEALDRRVYAMAALHARPVPAGPTQDKMNQFLGIQMALGFMLVALRY
jgi:phage terminase large subunit GpA-like protein